MVELCYTKNFQKLLGQNGDLLNRLSAIFIYPDFKRQQSKK
jgi:hypothetical protein